MSLFSDLILLSLVQVSFHSSFHRLPTRLLGCLWLWLYFGWVGLFSFTLIAQQPSESPEDNPRLNPNAQRIPSSIVSGPVSEVDLEQFVDFGFIFLKESDLKLDSFLEQGTTGNQTKAVLKFDYRNFILNEIINTNRMIIRKMSESLNTNQSQEVDLLLQRDRLIEAIDPDYFSSADVKPSGSATSETKRAFQNMSTENLFPDSKLTGIILNSADLVEVFEVEINGTVEKMLSLRGGVDITFNQNNMKAKLVDINITTRNIYGTDGVVLTIGSDVVRGNNVILNLKEQVGYVFDSKGVWEGNYFEGKLLRVNERDHFTIEEGWITFSSNSDPYYRLDLARFDSYGKDKSIFYNSLVYVHNQPFLWVPYFMRYPVSTSLQLTFGENRRVGYYILTRTSFDIPYVNELILDFNVYEKLGLYLSLQNKNKILSSNYDLLVALAYYTENLNIRTKPEKLTYTYHTGLYINSVSSLRHKVEYSHNFDFADTTQSLVKSSLKFKLKNVSDPFITGNFPLNLKHFDIRKLIERHDRDESLYTASPTDRDSYNLDYNLSAPAVSLAISLGWAYDIYKDLNKLDRPIDEQYTMYLKTVTLPKINFRLNSTFDPIDAKSERPFFLNVGYNFSLLYSGIYNYKDGVAKGEGSGLLASVEPYAITKENFNLQLSGSLSRGFTIDEDKNSLWDLGFDWFSWSLNNSMNISYKKNWVGKNYTGSDNIKDDVGVFSIGYSFSSSMKFNTGLATWFDFVLGNSFSLSTDETTYFYKAADITKYSLPTTESIKNYRTSYSFSMNFNFPSARLKNEWGASYDFRSMLPVFSLNLISFNLRKRTSAENIAIGKNYEFDIYESRDFSSSLSGSHKGYGLFFLSGFDYVLSSSVNFSYNLMPDKDENGNFSKDNFFTEKSFWTASRIKSFNGSSSLNFNYKIWNWYNTLSYYFYDTTTREIVNEVNQWSTRTTLTYKHTGGKWVNLDSINFEYKWLYHFQEKNYKSDSMSFSIGTTLDILSLFKITMSFSSVNTHSYLYFKDKADYFGQPKVDFFRDLGASFGFLGTTAQQQALFKMGRFSIGIVHDLDDWYTTFNYTIAPVNYNKESLRGFYFDHRIEFQVNLKPERDPRGSAEGSSSPFFEKLNKDLSPEAFKN